MQNLLKTRNYPEVGFEGNLRSLPVENLEQKVEKTSNKTGIVLISDGFCRFVFFSFLNLRVPRFLISNVYRSFGLQLDISWASRLNFLGIQVHIFWGDLKPYRFWSVKVSLLFGASTS